MTRSSLRLEAAAAGDDEGIRALLRRQVMDGSIRLTFEREPDSRHAATVEGERHHVFVARRGSGDADRQAARERALSQPSLSRA